MPDILITTEVYLPGDDYEIEIRDLTTAHSGPMYSVTIGNLTIYCENPDILAVRMLDRLQWLRESGRSALELPQD